MRRALLAVLLLACRDEAARTDPLPEVWMPRGRADDPVVARVDGTPIFASEVLLRRAQRDGGPVLDDLVLEDLLAAEARRQGLLADPSVRDAARSAIARQLLEEDFERRVRPETIPESLLKRAYERNYWFYNKPEIRHFEHLLVDALWRDPPEKRRAAAAFADEILADLSRRRPASLEAVRDEVVRRAAAKGLTVQYERSMGVRARLERDFGDVLWSLSPGELGRRPARSRYGFHLLRLVRIEPALERPFESVREDVRARLWPEYRQTELQAWLKDLRARHGASVTQAARDLFGRGPRPENP